MGTFLPSRFIIGRGEILQCLLPITLQCACACTCQPESTFQCTVSSAADHACVILRFWCSFRPLVSVWVESSILRRPTDLTTAGRQRRPGNSSDRGTLEHSLVVFYRQNWMDEPERDDKSTGLDWWRRTYFLYLRDRELCTRFADGGMDSRCEVHDACHRRLCAGMVTAAGRMDLRDHSGNKCSEQLAVKRTGIYSSSSATSPLAAFAFSMIFSCSCPGTMS